MRTPPTAQTPPRSNAVAQSKTERSPTPRPAKSFQALLRGGAEPAVAFAAGSPTAAAQPAVAPPGPTRSRSPGDAPEREGDGRAPAPPLHDALREPSAACFASAMPSSASPLPAAAATTSAADPVALAVAAEQVLRSLRVGTDARGRSLVLLDVAAGALAGCRIELRRVDAGVEVQVRDDAGAPDPRERDVIDALRRRGIDVVGS